MTEANKRYVAEETVDRVKVFIKRLRTRIEELEEEQNSLRSAVQTAEWEPCGGGIASVDADDWATIRKLSEGGGDDKKPEVSG